jgi:hypothetical protein
MGPETIAKNGELMRLFWSVWLLAFISSYSFGAARLPGEFRPKDEPSQVDWAYFMSQSIEWRTNLWSYHKKVGDTFESWNWAWRIGWIKTCVSSKEASYCSEVIQKAEKDDALVVRNELAKSLGSKYAESKNPKTVATLLRMFKDKRNFMGEKPTFIHETILFSLKQVGDYKGIADAKKLAGKHPKLLSYMDKIHKAG